MEFGSQGWIHEKICSGSGWRFYWNPSDSKYLVRNPPAQNVFSGVGPEGSHTRGKKFEWRNDSWDPNWFCKERGFRPSFRFKGGVGGAHPSRGEFWRPSATPKKKPHPSPWLYRLNKKIDDKIEKSIPMITLILLWKVIKPPPPSSINGCETYGKLSEGRVRTKLSTDNIPGGRYLN